MKFPIILYDINRNIITKELTIKSNCQYFYSYQNLSVKILEGTGILFSVKQDGQNLITDEGQEFSDNFGYTLYIPNNLTQVKVEVSTDTESDIYLFNLSYDNITNETNEHYNDLLINNYLPSYLDLEQCIPDEFNKAELIKRLLLDFKNILRHKGTKKSIEKVLNFIGFDQENLTVYEEYLNRKSQTFTLIPNKQTDVKTGNYHVIYDNYTQDALDENNMPLRYIIIQDLDRFSQHLLNAIALVNIYFTCEEQTITVFSLGYSSNIPAWNTIFSNMNMIFENDVFDFRKYLSINVDSYFTSTMKTKVIENCLQKTNTIYKSEAKLYLEDKLTKNNNEIYFIDQEIFDDEEIDPLLDITKIEKIFGNIFHLNIISPNTYVEFEVVDKNNPLSKLTYPKEYLTNNIRKIIVLNKTSQYQLKVNIYDTYNNRETYFYDLNVSLNVQMIDFEMFNSGLIALENDVKNNITIDVDSQENISTPDPIISGVSNFVISPNSDVPTDMQTYFNTTVTEMFQWVSENARHENLLINKKHVLNNCSETISLEMLENWLEIIAFKYINGYTLKLRVYDKNINERIIIDISEIGTYDRFFDKLYVMVFDVFDRNEDNSIQDTKTPYYFITSTEIGIDFNQQTYDFVLIKDDDATEIYSIYDLPESLGSITTGELITNGLLYNYYAAMDVRNICAVGWHVPSRDEFVTLQTYLGGYNPAGIALSENDIAYWTSLLLDDFTNSAKFNGRGAGIRWFYGGFQNYRYTLYLMDTSTPGPAGTSGNVILQGGQFLTSLAGKSAQNGLSIRLIKDSTTLSHGQSGTYTGNDGTVYRTICIGTQEFVADNLVETKYRNGDTISIVTDNTSWSTLTTSAMCYPNGDINNVKTQIFIDKLTNNIKLLQRKLPVNHDFPLFPIDSEIALSFIPYISTEGVYTEEIVAQDSTKTLPVIKSIYQRLVNVSEDIYNQSYDLKLLDIVLCRLNDKYIVHAQDIIWKVYNSFTNEIIFETKEFSLKYQITENLCFDVSCDFVIDNIPYNIFKKSVFSSFKI